MASTYFFMSGKNAVGRIVPSALRHGGAHLLQMKALYDEIKNSGLMELSEDELNQAVGGTEDSKSWEVFRDAWRMLDDLPAGSTVSISYKEKLL